MLFMIPPEHYSALSGQDDLSELEGEFFLLRRISAEKAEELFEKDRMIAFLPCSESKSPPETPRARLRATSRHEVRLRQDQGKS